MPRSSPDWSEATLRPDHPLAEGADTTPPGLDDPALPTRIGRYFIVDELGAGGMGVVYSAYDPELDRKVAIKLMYSEVDRDRARRSQALLLREAQALAKLSHPNIVAIHDVGVHADKVFVAMEFVAGRTVRRWQEEAPRGWQAIVDVFVQAGRGLMAAHAAGLVHRDVKPDNLLVGDDARVRVADFGVARFNVPDEAASTGDLSGSRPLATVAGRGALVGTPVYMAPEQHDNTGVGPHSDQFSFYWAQPSDHPFRQLTSKLPGRNRWVFSRPAVRPPTIIPRPFPPGLEKTRRRGQPLTHGHSRPEHARPSAAGVAISATW